MKLKLIDVGVKNTQTVVWGEGRGTVVWRKDIKTEVWGEGRGTVVWGKGNETFLCNL